MKKFYEMTKREVVAVLVEGRMPDGTRIDLDTAKASLARMIPMLKELRIEEEPDAELEKLIAAAERKVAS